MDPRRLRLAGACLALAGLLAVGWATWSQGDAAPVAPAALAADAEGEQPAEERGVQDSVRMAGIICLVAGLGLLLLALLPRGAGG